MAREDRNSILVEDATVVSNESYDAEQHVVRLLAPAVARRAQPGQFIHMRCGDDLPMRRPMSIMRVDKQAGFRRFSVQNPWRWVGPAG